jgi:hypothetical protein
MWIGLAGLALLAGGLAACGGQPTTACTPKDKAVVVCVNGKPIDFSTAKNGPHKHEAGSIYAPVEQLAGALGVDIMVDPGGKTVTVNGQKVQVVGVPGAMGVHVHSQEIFVPVREFARAAGLKVDVDDKKGIAGIAK